MYDVLGITDGADNQEELLLDGNGSPLRWESPYELSVGVAYHQISDHILSQGKGGWGNKTVGRTMNAEQEK